MNSPVTTTPAADEAAEFVIPDDLHLMIDIETLDTTPSAMVLSAGWAWFEPTGVIASGSATFDLDTQRRLGRTISPDTVRWWKGQAEPLPEPNPGTDLRLFIAKAMRSYYEARPQAVGKMEPFACAAGVWANAPSFDLVILRHWADQLRLPIPWSFRRERCMRTWRAMAENAAQILSLEMTPWPGTTRHEAEQDARDQANYMIVNRAFAPLSPQEEN
jgi:hypothetical protein